MRSFRHTGVALRIYQGDGSLAGLGRELDRLECKRAVVVCGHTLAHDGGVQGMLQEALAHRLAGVWGGARSHCPLPTLSEAVEALKAHGADCVVALGGGSAMVTARAASIVLAEGGDVRQLCTVRSPGGSLISPRLLRRKIPQFVVPSTPTAAIAKAGTAVRDVALRERLALFDPKTRPTAIFVHPPMTRAVPVEVVRSAAMYSLLAAIQGLESSQADPVSDALLLHAVVLLAPNLLRLNLEPNAEATRMALIEGAIVAGQGTEHAPLGLASAIAHSLGLLLDCNQALANAVMTPHVLEFNDRTRTPERRAIVSRAIRELRDVTDAPEESDDSLQVTRFLANLRAPSRLRDLGVEASALARIANHVVGDWYVSTNPRPLKGRGEILSLLEKAW